MRPASDSRSAIVHPRDERTRAGLRAARPGAAGSAGSRTPGRRLLDGRAPRAGPGSGRGDPVPEESIRGSFWLALGGDGQEPGGLVDDQEVGVLVNEPQRLWAFGRWRRGQLHSRVVGDRNGAVAEDCAVDANPRSLEPLLDAAPRRSRELGLQSLGEPHGRYGNSVLSPAGEAG